MPPKFKFTKEEIITAALDIARSSGMDALTARSLAAKLGTSPKPIFGQFQSMEEVQQAVMKKAEALYEAYISEDMASGQYPTYKASGMAYIRFAKEEAELFKLLFMRDRSGETIQENRKAIRPFLEIIMCNLGITEDDAYLFHLENWIYVHGIATMVATSYLDWDLTFVSNSLTDVYQGLKCRYISKGES